MASANRMNASVALPEATSHTCILHPRSTSASSVCAHVASQKQGLTLAHFRAQLEDLRDTTLPVELTLSTFRPHPRVDWGYTEDRVSSS
jgi:hypothetical protein